MFAIFLIYILICVIAGLVPAIHGARNLDLNDVRTAHVLRSTLQSQWITGTSPLLSG